MIAAELRDLLAEVEKHGGPNLSAWVNEHELRQWHHLGVWHGKMIAFGVLKDDLIERGYHVAINLGVTKEGDYPCFVQVFADDIHSGGGDSELEAILKAWLAAAEAEGWTV